MPSTTPAPTTNISFNPDHSITINFFQPVLGIYSAKMVINGNIYDPANFWDSVTDLIFQTEEFPRLGKQDSYTNHLTTNAQKKPHMMDVFPNYDVICVKKITPDQLQDAEIWTSIYGRSQWIANFRAFLTNTEENSPFSDILAQIPLDFDLYFYYLALGENTSQNLD